MDPHYSSFEIILAREFAEVQRRLMAEYSRLTSATSINIKDAGAERSGLQQASWCGIPGEVPERTSEDPSHKTSSGEQLGPPRQSFPKRFSCASSCSSTPSEEPPDALDPPERETSDPLEVARARISRHSLYSYGSCASSTKTDPSEDPSQEKRHELSDAAAEEPHTACMSGSSGASGASGASGTPLPNRTSTGSTGPTGLAGQAGQAGSSRPGSRESRSSTASSSESSSESEAETRAAPSQMPQMIRIIPPGVQMGALSPAGSLQVAHGHLAAVQRSQLSAAPEPQGVTVLQVPGAGPRNSKPSEEETTVQFQRRRPSSLGVSSTSNLRRPSMMSAYPIPDDDEEAGCFNVLPIWQGGNRSGARASVAILGAGGRTRTNFLEQKQNSTLAELTAAQDLMTRLLNRFIIYPSSIKRLGWELCGLLLILYDCIAIPLEVFDLPDAGFPTAMGWITRFFWSFNIPISLITGYLKNDGTVEVRPWEVAKRYCFSWLVIDLIVVISDWLQVGLSSMSGLGLQRLMGVLRIMRVFRVTRVVRSVQAPEMTEFVNEYIRSEQVRLIAEILKYMLAIVAVSHVMACLWYWIGLNADADPGGYGWIKMQNVESWDVSQKYALAFHWALSTFSGNLLMNPTNGSERAFTICVILFTIIVSAALIGSLTTAMTRLQIIANEQSQRLSTLRRYLMYQNITRPLAVRIFQNAQHALAEQKKNLPESSVELLQIISGPLLVELHFEIYARTLVEHMFFVCYQDINPTGIKKVCHTAVSMLSLSAGDVLFSNLEVPAWRRMFFVVDGRLNYKQECTAAETAEKGHWLCEPVLWTQWTHCGTCKAETQTRLLELDAEKFQLIISMFPTDHAELYAGEFIIQLNMLERDALTDLDTLSASLPLIIDQVFPTDASDSESDADGSDKSDKDSVSKSSSKTGRETPDGTFTPLSSFMGFRASNNPNGNTGRRLSRQSNDGFIGTGRLSLKGNARASQKKTGKRSVMQAKNVRFQSVVGLGNLNLGTRLGGGISARVSSMFTGGSKLPFARGNP